MYIRTLSYYRIQWLCNLPTAELNKLSLILIETWHIMDIKLFEWFNIRMLHVRWYLTVS